MTDRMDIHPLLTEVERQQHDLWHAEQEAELAKVEQNGCWYTYLSAKKKAAEAVGHRAWKREAALAEVEKATAAFCAAFLAYEDARGMVKQLAHAYEELQARVSTGCREWLQATKPESERLPEPPQATEALSP